MVTLQIITPNGSSLFPLSRIIFSCNNGFSSLNMSRSMTRPGIRAIEHSIKTWTKRARKVLSKRKRFFSKIYHWIKNLVVIMTVSDKLKRCEGKAAADI